VADDTRTPLDVAMQVTRFWSLVKVGEPDDCWPWIGYEEDDYGRKYEHHALQAEAHLAANNGKPSPERVAMAQVHATLAVAYASMLTAART